MGFNSRTGEYVIIETPITMFDLKPWLDHLEELKALKAKGFDVENAIKTAEKMIARLSK